MFEGALAGLVLAEVDGLTREAVLAVEAPEWVVREVTDDPAYWGWALAGR